jgi:hypothetical protein
MNKDILTSLIQEPKITLRLSKLVLVPENPRDFFWADLLLEEGDTISFDKESYVYYCTAKNIDDLISKDDGDLFCYSESLADGAMHECSIMYLGYKVESKKLTTLEILNAYKFLVLDTQEIIWVNSHYLGDSIASMTRRKFFEEYKANIQRKP